MRGERNFFLHGILMHNEYPIKIRLNIAARWHFIDGFYLYSEIAVRQEAISGGSVNLYPSH